MEKLEILPIVLNEDTMKRVEKKEETMVRALFTMMLAEKRSSIESLEK
jgi:hypothetical protein